jgi:hypothetical protein
MHSATELDPFRGLYRPGSQRMWVLEAVYASMCV